MYSLYLDSSNVDLCVGIASEDVVDFTIYEAWQSQSEYMVQEIDKLLDKHHICREDIKDVTVTIGPGSYTGIRIALTIAKVMCLALNIPLYTLSSLSVLRDLSRPSICIMNARSGRSYVGVYHQDKVILKDQIMNNEDLLNYIKDHPDYALCGELKYLGLEGVKSNVILNMIALQNLAEKNDDAINVKPVYLKD